MQLERGSWWRFLSRALVLCAMIFGTMRVALAWEGRAGVESRSFLTVAGTIHGVTATPRLRFLFHKGAESCDVTPEGVAVTFDTSTSAFTAQIDYDRCTRAFFDGANVTVDVFVNDGTMPVVAAANVNPVPYAHFANVAGVANVARRSGPYGLSLAFDAARHRLCVQCWNAPCSESNPGFVVLPGRMAGQVETYRVASEVCVFDSLATTDRPDIVNQVFGTTAGVAWGEDRPFALYACAASTDVRFALSPDPTITVTPAASAIGYPGTAPMTPTDSSMFFLSRTAEPDRPCALIGSLRMRKNIVEGWEVRALNLGDGIDRYTNFSGRVFTMPTGQRGSVSGQHLHFDRADATATLPTYASALYTYRIGIDGNVDVSLNFINRTGGTRGRSDAGAVLILALPYTDSTAHRGISIGAVYATSDIGVATFSRLMHAISVEEAVYFQFDESTGTTLHSFQGNQQNGDFRTIQGSFRFQPFQSP